jgi:hypothetical protein
VGGRGTPRDQDTEAVKQPALSAPSDDNKTKAAKEIDGADSASEGAGLTSTRAENEKQKNAAKKAEAGEDKRQFGSLTADASAARKARRSGEAQPKDVSPSAGATMDERAGSREDRPASKPEERRSAGGRQFVRRGGAWTDTAYRGQATTSVRRGSDQYRALVADEPGLRAIADQLGGEVIIVWNGRAYRIH